MSNVTELLEGSTMETDETSLLPMNALVPVLPLRDVVVYPHMVIPLFVGREKSIDALDVAMKEDKQVFNCTERSGN